MTVSKQTQGFVGCLVSLNNLYSQFGDVVQDMYSGEQADKMLSGEFTVRHNALQKVIEKFMCVSISENIGSGTEITEI